MREHRFTILEDQQIHLGDARYVRLQAEESWEAFAKVGPHPDLTVPIGNGELVFWRGTSYLPIWKTEGGEWVFEEMVARRGDGPTHRPDDQCRMSFVKVLETTPARAMVLWRYVADHGYPQLDGWVEERFTMYPDGVCVREMRNAKGTTLAEWGDETHRVMRTYLMAGTGPLPLPAGLVEPAKLRPGERAREWFEWDEEWRVGKYADVVVQFEQSPDRFVFWRGTCQIPCWANGGNFWYTSEFCERRGHQREGPVLWKRKLMLHGLTTNDAVNALVSLAKSWERPPELRVTGNNPSAVVYDKRQRAYQMDWPESSVPGRVRLVLEASLESPAVNPCLVIGNWPRGCVAGLAIDDVPLTDGAEFRQGLELSGEDAVAMVIWVRHLSISATEWEVVARRGDGGTNGR